MGSAGARVESSDNGIFVVLQLFSQLARAKPVNRFDKKLSNKNFAKFTCSLLSAHRIKTSVFALVMTFSLAIFCFFQRPFHIWSNEDAMQGEVE